MTTDLASLLAHPAVWRASQFHASQQLLAYRQSGDSPGASSVPTGFSRLDRELPGQGWPHDELTELLLPRHGQGELSLLLPALAQLSADKRHIAWINPPYIPYPPALIAAGIRMEQLLCIRTQHPKESLWALETCLGSGACRAVLGWADRLQTPQLRRLQLAAQQGRCWGVLLRPKSEAGNASPAPLRIELGALTQHSDGQARLDVRILKRRGQWGSDWISLFWASTALVSRPHPTTLRTIR